VPLVYPNQRLDVEGNGTDQTAKGPPPSPPPSPPPYIIHAGRYIWQFEFDLASTLPPTIKTTHSNTEYYMLYDFKEEEEEEKKWKFGLLLRALCPEFCELF